MEMIGGLSRVTQMEAWKMVSLSSQRSHPQWLGGKWVLEQCLCNVLETPQSFKLLSAVYSSAAVWQGGLSAPALSPWAQRLSQQECCPPGDQSGEVVCHLRLAVLKTPPQGCLHCRRIACLLWSARSSAPKQPHLRL